MIEDVKVKATIVAGFDSSQVTAGLSKVGDDIEGFKRRQNSAEGIKLATNVAELRLYLKQLREDLKKVTDDKTRIEIQTNIELVSKQLRQADRELTNFLRTGDKTTSVLGNMFGSIKTGFLEIARGIGVFTLVQRAIDLLVQGVSQGMQDALQLEGLYGALDRLSAKVGETRNTILDSLREASDGTVADIDLIKSANKALSLGVGQSAEDIATLLEIARLKSKAFGTSTTEAFNDIVTGLGRSSPLILDNLGITIKLGEANEIYANSIGKTVAQLTDAEKKQALINAVVKQGNKELLEAGEIALTTSERFAQFKARLNNTAASVGQYILFIVLKIESYIRVIDGSIELLAIDINKALRYTELYINDTLSFFQGIVSAFKAVGHNIGSAFSQGITGMIQLGVNGVISLVEGAINNILGSVNSLSKTLSKIPGIGDIFGGQVGSVKLGRVDFGARFDFKNIGSEFKKSFNNGANDVIRQTIKGLDLMRDEVETRAATILNDSGKITLSGVQTDLSKISKGGGDGDTGSSSTGGKKGESAYEKELKKREKEEEEALKRRVQKNKEALKEQQKDAEEYLKSFDNEVKLIDKSIEDLGNQIKKANDELTKLSEKQLSEEEKLASKYLELQKKKSGSTSLGDGETMSDVLRDLELIEKYTTEAQRQEAQRVSLLSDTQKIVEEIDKIKGEKSAKEEEIKALEQQKEFEMTIYTSYLAKKEELEKRHTLFLQQESRLRMNQLQAEINKTFELMRLRESAAANSFVTDSQLAQSVTNNKTVSNDNYTINVNGSVDTDKLYKDIKTGILNKRLGNNS